MTLELDQLPTLFQQPYYVKANLPALLKRAEVGARFETSVPFNLDEIDFGHGMDGNYPVNADLAYPWPDRRLALAGCKLQATIEWIQKNRWTPQYVAITSKYNHDERTRSTEIKNNLITQVELSIGDDVKLFTLAGRDLPCEVQAMRNSPTTFSAVWDLPISTPISIYTILCSKVQANAFGPYTITNLSLIPQLLVIDPTESSMVSLERWLVHRQPSAGTIKVPLPKQRIKSLTFEERNLHDNALTPVASAVLQTLQGDPLLELSDRAIANRPIELSGLDCSGCELLINFTPQLLKHDPRLPRDVICIGHKMNSEWIGLDQFGNPLMEFRLLMIAKQDLYTSPTCNGWQ